MGVFLQAVTVCSGMCSIITLALFIIKPAREKLLGTKKIQESLKCTLRQQMLHTYYTNKDAKEIRQYEKENFLKSADAYFALKGNSFVEDIVKEVREWEVIS